MDELTRYLIILGTVLILGYFLGVLVRRVKLPSLLGYMLLGIFLGKSAFRLVTDPDLLSLSFITEVTLGFVAFMIGSELNLTSLRRLGFGIIAIILSESFMAFFIVLVAVYLVTFDLPLSLIFGAMAPASAPAGTVAVIQEYRAKGTLTQALYAVVGFDDGLAIVIFGFAAAIARSLLDFEATGIAGGVHESLAAPFIEIVMSVIVGVVCGFFLSFIVRRIKQDRDYLIMVFGFVLVATGLSQWLHASLILSNMIVGFMVVNTCRSPVVSRVLKQVQPIMPLLFILFFFIAGAHIHLAMLPALGLLGIVYIMGRSSGLILGAYVGAVIGKAEEKIKRYLGYGILSQAGVAIGLALIVQREFSAVGTEHARMIGETVIASITATSIFFEIVGPILTRISLTKAGEINKAPED